MDPNLLFTQVTTAAALAYFLKLLQKWEQLPWITAHTAQVSGWVRAFLALIGTIGISYQWNSTAHSLLITGLSWGVILPGLWHWFGQFALQHGWGQLFNIGTLSKVDAPVQVVNAKGEDKGSINLQGEKDEKSTR
jgi:hypothetical protein